MKANTFVHLGLDGKLVYVPDVLGNRILDFSNSGYEGGGVKIADVQARVAVEPGDGDDTARIQAAIDRVSQMPMSAEGIRGAVLLKKGTYQIGGTLHISASGVVLRGEGQGEDGTVLYSTGAVKRNILEIKGTAGPEIIADTRTSISDLYVPSGARSFHVADASRYKAGDKVIVQRHGNSRWIHAIGMDQIYDRPGTTGETKQWTPFDLNFDRVITAVDGNLVTVDAPLANSFDIRYGGGDLYKYEISGELSRSAWRTFGLMSNLIHQ